jgi:DNA replication ATP-dependent helicase Dna2
VGGSLLRLGRETSIHPAARKYTPEAFLAARQRGQGQEGPELASFLASKTVVCCTALGVTHALFPLLPRFDVCVVDEAGQMALPVCLGPLRHAETFVLVGDHNQLPPLVKSRKAQEGGMDESLFKRLQQPGATVSLARQFRMHAHIMLLSNSFVYQHELKCASEAVATQRLALPGLAAALAAEPPSRARSTPPRRPCSPPTAAGWRGCSLPRPPWCSRTRAKSPAPGTPAASVYPLLSLVAHASAAQAPCRTSARPSWWRTQCGCCARAAARRRASA